MTTRQQAPIADDALSAVTDPVLGAALEALYVGRDNKALIVAEAGRVISLNRLAADLCGRTEAGLLGKAISDLFSTPPAAGTSPGRTRWETTLSVPSIPPIPVEISREPLGSRLPDCLVYAVRDLRERREIAAERAAKDRAIAERDRELHIQAQRFDTAVGNMAQGLVMLDGDGRLLVANMRFAEMLDLSAFDLAPGTRIAEILALAPGLAGADHGAFTADTLLEPGESVLHLAAGRLVAVARRPMPDGGIVATLTDVTEREEARRRLAAYTASLETSNEDLQSFAYVASHDLQEPLRKIETFAGRIMQRHAADLPDGVAMPMERIIDATRRMRVLINDLLAYARLDKETVPSTEVDLEATLAGVLSDLAVRIEETGATVRHTPLPVVAGHATQLRQLLQNLLSNALKFSRPGVPPVIEIAARLESAPGARGHLVVTVADNGIGFDNKDKDKIFKIFHRLHGRAEYEGTGVGLATCRKIAERHHGSIDADGRPGEGATFTVVLPSPVRHAA